MATVAEIRAMRQSNLYREGQFAANAAAHDRFVQEWELTRVGQFTVRTFGRFHCGTKDVLKVNYNLKVVCGEGSLDERGFLFDQTKVQALVDTITATSESCEMFCRTIAKAVYKQILTENSACDITLFELSLSPEPFQASITFRLREVL